MLLKPVVENLKPGQQRELCKVNTMRNFKITSTIAALTVCSVLFGCSDNDDDYAGDTAGGTDNTVSYAFNTDEPGAYTRVDRAGMPAISTALIASKDSYNAANPVDDSNGVFVPEILASLEFLHGALDGQLTDLGLTPCTVVGDGTGTCAAAAVPLILPDTVKINTANAAGFPNGRMLPDPVIGVTLAVALLELTGDPAPHTATALVGALNPAANDKEFSENFPYLAPAHQ